ncbi:MAG: hypothetical protein N2C14_31645 [Planctomycetales bacterium]
MQEQEKHRVCPDCQAEMTAIRLLDATTTMDFGSESGGHVDLHYAVAEAEVQTGWHERYVPIAGKVAGVMCPNCGRIILIAVPKD